MLQIVSQLLSQVIPPFHRHMFMQQAALLHAEQAMAWVGIFEKKI